jgi:predicted RNA-binding Zn ribbon-like protein
MTQGKEKQQPPFDLCGGHPALDFVNSLDQRFDERGSVESLCEYGDLLRFTQQTSLLHTRQVRRLGNTVTPEAAARALRAARELREAMAATFYGCVDGRAPPPADIRTFERYFRAASAHQELLWKQPAENSSGRSAMAWDWGRFESNAELPVWIMSQSASQLMLSDAMDRVRACGVDTCRWLFLDTSKNHTRRWCKMKVCGNRMKARRFQARREA